MTEKADILRDSKFGPMLGKQEVNLGTATEDFVSPYKTKKYFTVTVTQLASSGDSILTYVDALGNRHTEAFSAVGQILCGGPPGSSHPVPLWVEKLEISASAGSSTTVRKVQVAW